MIVYTGGTFDLLHVGHLELLRACRQIADQGEREGRGRVVVSLNRDAFVERYKGRQPAQSYAVREEIVRALAMVDLVVCNTGDEDSSEAIDVVRPDVLAIGSDWETLDYLGQLGISQAWLDERGLRIRYIPRTRGQSSTAIREAMAS